MRKQTICICENKDADQLRGNPWFSHEVAHFPLGFTPSSIGQVASQEELDSVINLLSGVGTGSASTNHMSPISEQHSPHQGGPHQGQVSLQVPLMYRPPRSPAASDSGVDVAKTHRNPAQRRSEGSIDLSGFGNPGRNTWPHQHRSSLPGQ